MSTPTAFPILKNGMILQIMTELDIPLTESELTEPGRCKERVREVLQLLRRGRQLVAFGYDAAVQRRTTIWMIRLNSNERQLCCKTRCPYGILLMKRAPNGRRFKRQLSALINFMKYREDMGHLLETALDESFVCCCTASGQSTAVLVVQSLSNVLHFQTSSSRHYIQRVDMFNALEEMAEEHMTLQDRLEVARSENHAKMLEQDAAEAECQEQFVVFCTDWFSLASPYLL
eukprot:scaffold275_cov221-Alexandrium_tamarense.AAC.11